MIIVQIKTSLLHPHCSNHQFKSMGPKPHSLNTKTYYYQVISKQHANYIVPYHHTTCLLKQQGLSHPVTTYHNITISTRFSYFPKALLVKPLPAYQRLKNRAL